MKFIEGWINKDVSLEVVFKYINWLLNEYGFKTTFEEMKFEYDNEDFMMLLLYNKFQKYKSFTVEDALNMNIKEEFDSMFSVCDLLNILRNDYIGNRFK